MFVGHNGRIIAVGFCKAEVVQLTVKKILELEGFAGDWAGS